MLYKRKKIMKKTRKIPNRPYIGVIETTMMFQSAQDHKEQLISVFTLFVEEPSRHLILIRYYDDFKEFHKRMKTYLKKFNLPLPKLHHEDERNMFLSDEEDQHNTHSSSSSIDQSLKKKLLNHLVKKSRTRYYSSSTSNSENLERYLRYCVNDPIIHASSLFKEFLQPQREEDNIIPKTKIIQESIVHHQEQQQSMIQSDIILENHEIIGACGPTPPPDDDALCPLPSSIYSYTSFTSRIEPISTEAAIPATTLSNTSTSTTSIASSEQTATIQDFQLIKVIGRGCMGKVLLVRHKKTQKLLALKAINKKTVIEQSQIVHIKAEQQILADVSSIHHPFLVKLHYSFQDMNQLFLVLDYHVGGDLATQLRINQVLPPDRCRFYTAEIVLGIQELHRLGILYRDLKPENILLTADGHIVLTDFGLSKQFYDGLSLEDQRTDTFCGTAEYLAPEILNQQPYSYEVDYWSLGTILYEMLTGITPFWAENQSEMYQRIREDRLCFPGTIDVTTADFIAQLLKRDPKRRLGSGGKEGALLVRSHFYFEVVDWQLMYMKRIRPPYIPQLYSETDFSHFDSEFLKESPRLSPVESEYMMTQSLDRAFEGYSYTNREESIPASPPSEMYDLEEPPSPMALMDATRMNADDDDDGNGLRCFVYNESDEVVPYDDYGESSIISSGGDDIHSSDLVRPDSDIFRRNDYDEMDIPPRPAGPVTVSMSPSFIASYSSDNSSSIISSLH